MWGVDGRLYKCGVWIGGFINVGYGWEGLYMWGVDGRVYKWVWIGGFINVGCEWEAL